METKGKKLYDISIGLVVLFLVWLFIAQAVGNNNLFPTPLVTFARLSEIVAMPNFFVVVTMTIIRVVAGLTLALMAAILLGVLSVYWPLVNTLLRPVVAVVKAMPNISVIVQLILLLGPMRAPSAVGFLVVFPLLYAAVIEGLGNVNADLLEMADVFQVPKSYILANIYFPSVSSYLSAALAAAVGLNIKIIIGAEYIGYTKLSIGNALHLSRAYLDIPGVLAWSVIAIVTAFVMELPAKWLKRYIGGWKEV